MPDSGDPTRALGQVEISVIQEMRYHEGHVKNWTMDRAMSTDGSDKPRPGIVVISWRWLDGGDKLSFPRPVDLPTGHIHDFARHGDIAATINNRLVGEAVYPAAIQDCKKAVRFLRVHANDDHIDPDRIGAWGNSACGHLALMLGMVDDSHQLEGDGPFFDHSRSAESSSESQRSSLLRINSSPERFF